MWIKDRESLTKKLILLLFDNTYLLTEKRTQEESIEERDVGDDDNRCTPRYPLDMCSVIK